MRTREVALSIIFSALYAGLVLVFSPISFWITQVRIADCLIPLSVLFGWPVIIGVTLGCAVSNVVTPLPSVFLDVTLGSLANFLASFGAYKVASVRSSKFKKFLACLISSSIVTIIVGTYVAWLLNFPLWVGLAGLFVGSFISMCIMGYALLSGLGGMITE